VNPQLLLDEAMAIIDRQEDVLFKIASGRLVNARISRENMMDMAEQVLPKRLQDLLLNQGRIRT